MAADITDEQATVLKREAEYRAGKRPRIRERPQFMLSEREHAYLALLRQVISVLRRLGNWAGEEELYRDPERVPPGWQGYIDPEDWKRLLAAIPRVYPKPSAEDCAGALRRLGSLLRRVAYGRSLSEEPLPQASTEQSERPSRKSDEAIQHDQWIFDQWEEFSREGRRKGERRTHRDLDRKLGLRAGETTRALDRHRKWFPRNLKKPQ